MTAQPVDLQELYEATAVVRRTHLWMWDIPAIRGTPLERDLLLAQRVLEQHCRDLALPPTTLTPRTANTGPRTGKDTSL